MMPLMLPLPFSPHPTFQRPVLQHGGAEDSLESFF